MSRNIFKIEAGQVHITTTDPWPAIGADVCAATPANFGPEVDVSCQSVNVSLDTSQSVNREEAPAVWCKGGEASSSIVSVVDEQTVSLNFILDEDQREGTARWLYEHSGERAWILASGADGDPPLFVAEVRIVAPSLFGAARTVRTATVSLPVENRAAVCFGRKGSSVGVANPPDPMNVSAQHAAAAAMADLATLKADATVGDGHYTGPAFTKGQYVVLGDRSQAHYATAVWTSGAAV